MLRRRPARQIYIGDVAIGGDAPIVVQSMTNTDTRDVEATVRQIEELTELGCEVIRVAVPDRQAAEAIAEMKKRIRIPLVADIHFDYRLALLSLESGADALRLNPGNVRRLEQVKAVVKAAKERHVPIRIGVNAGSLPPSEGSALGSDAMAEAQPIANRMVNVALAQVRLLEEMDFDLIKVSLKAFDVPTTVEAYRQIAAKIPYPLHLGITEAGTPRAGTVRSAVGIGILLYSGIGDTIRVSLTDRPHEEVKVAYEILKALNLRERGPTLISCPSCGRAEIDIIKLANEVEQHLQQVEAPLHVAVMGCVVNGPGEARQADVGIAGGAGRGVIFRKGRVIRTVKEDELLSALLKEIDLVTRELKSQ
ncbi:MAG: flavodoxin-dependent (E)-4-hydroxy-3-methylbut-2-enyl-diphosphate synthase [Chloroflexi bacterium]|nr:flavodoxin-dependent (E)-4-hydroxy-3-methylbut-2-enyl-diphosphate synthase [Chloroflexota bacterium]